MEAPPFQVLTPVRRVYYEPPLERPPPSRAPEPYKVAPQGSYYGRSQRKSSFAIIAEPRPPSPVEAESLASRPTSGRVSPFRGRGFKGPPPRDRSRSRPRSPSQNRPGALSQQNSPKRSQIPRPAAVAAARSGSAAKENGAPARKPSPKFGRRAANGYASSIAAANNANNRRAARATELPPIQGSPTKRTADAKDTKGSTRAVGGSERPSRAANRFNNRNLLAPPRIEPGGKRFITANNNNTPGARKVKAPSNGPNKALDSPSKIPRRQGLGASGKSDSTASLAKLESDRATATNNHRDNPGSGDNNPKLSGKKKSSSRDNVHNNSGSGGGGGDDQEPGLVELLRQSSGAMGTSSVVNTTTTTAIQPLQIDASTILGSEGELVAKLSNLEKKQQQAEANNPSPSPNPSQQSSLASAAQLDNRTNGPANAQTTTTTRETPAAADNSAATIAEEKARDDRMREETERQRESATPAASHTKTDSRSSMGHSLNKSTSGSTATDSKKLSPASRTNSATKNSSSVEDKKASLGRKKTGGPGSQDVLLENQAAATVSSEGESLHSTDTGVSVNTVKGVSSAKEKSGLHVVKRPEEIETLSGNIVHLENNSEQRAGPVGSKAARGPDKKKGRRKPVPRWRQRLRLSDANRQRLARFKGWCWPKMRCLACKREPKGQPWPGKQQARGQTASTLQLTLDSPDKPEGIAASPGTWARIKEACKCAKLRARTRLRPKGRGRRAQAGQVAPAETATRSRSCCPGGADRRLGGLCRGLFSRCACAACSCASCKKCCSCSCNCWPSWNCCKRAERPRNIRAKQSIASVAPPPVSEENRPKLPDVLIEHNSVMRGAIPCLPVPLAWFCLICNVLLPGSGSCFSGLFNLCSGQPRFSATASPKARLGAFIVNIVVGVSQLFTVLFCLVGWGWSIWWGVTMLRVAKKYKRFKESEAAANDPEARGGPEASLPAPGMAGQLRGK